MPPQTEKLLFIAMDDDRKAHLEWCEDRTAVALAVRNAMFTPDPILPEHQAMVEGVTDDLMEGGVHAFEGDAPLYLYRVPVATAFELGQGSAPKACDCKGGKVYSDVEPEGSPCPACTTPRAAAAPFAPIQGYDVGTSAGGVGYLVEYFATRLRTHTYQRYIEERLAKDFACTLAKHLSERDAAPAAPERLTDRQRHALEHAIGLVKREGVSNQHVINLQILLDKDARSSKTHCAARNGGAPGSEPQDCDWPGCGCDEAAMKVIEALQESGQLCTTTAQQDVIREREAHFSREGFSHARDDMYIDGQLAQAGAAYALAVADNTNHTMRVPLLPRSPDIWPWSERWWKPETPRRALVKAAALIIADIERIDRQAAQWPKPVKENQ